MTMRVSPPRVWAKEMSSLMPLLVWSTSKGRARSFPPGWSTATMLFPLETSIPTAFMRIPPNNRFIAMVNQTPHCRFDLLRADTNIQKRSSTCIKRTAGNGRMDDGLNCGRNVPGSTRQTNALSFYSLGNEVDKGRSRTASLIYKSIVIGSPDHDSLHHSAAADRTP